MQNTSTSPFHRPFPGQITLDNLHELFAHQRAQYGGWSMDANGGDGGDGGSGGDGSGGAGGDGGGQGGSGSGGTGRSNATDAQGNDLGFPKETPVAEMTDKEQAAYWRHKSRKHEGRVADLLGDRTPEQLKADLEAYAEYQKQQQTPAEQALSARFDEGKAAGLSQARTEAATAIFRGALEAGGIPEGDVDELVANFNVANYVTDNGIDTSKITNFAKRFAPSGKDDQRRRDFGGGPRGGGGSGRGAGGKAEAERRFGNKS